MKAVDVFDSLMSRACIDVFASYRVTLKEAPRPAPGASEAPPFWQEADGPSSLVAAVIGFTGEDLRGAVVLTSTFDVIARARPPSVGTQPLSKDSWSDWVMVRDWAGELGNQIVGRLKNRLIPFGLRLETSTPTAFSGRALSFAKPKLPMVRPFVFDALGDRVWLWLDANIDPGRVLVSRGEESAREGDVILF